jgi:uncharacterized membrane protein
MKLDNRIILITIVLLTLALFPIAIFTSGPLRLILSFFCMVIFPGYALVSALFPQQTSISIIERIAISFGASIAILAIIGFLLNFTPWGIQLSSILISVTAFILICAVIGFVRQQLLPEQLRFAIWFNINLSGWKALSRLNESFIYFGLNMCDSDNRIRDLLCSVAAAETGPA